MLRLMKMLILLVILIAGLLYWHFHVTLLPNDNGPNPYKYQTTSFVPQSIIAPDMYEPLVKEAKEYGYTNVNDPTLIEVPDWIIEPLGRYYLYFVHHKGEHIRMAYADTVIRPWTMYDGDVLTVSQSTMSIEAQSVSSWKGFRKYTSWSEARVLMQEGKEARVAYEKRVQQKLKSRTPTTPHVVSPEILVDHQSQHLSLYSMREGVNKISV